MKRVCLVRVPYFSSSSFSFCFSIHPTHRHFSFSSSSSLSDSPAYKHQQKFYWSTSLVASSSKVKNEEIEMEKEASIEESKKISPASSSVANNEIDRTQLDFVSQSKLSIHSLHSSLFTINSIARATSSSASLSVERQRRQTVRASYSALLRSALELQSEQLRFNHRGVNLSSLSPALLAAESIFFSMNEWSSTSSKEFSWMCQAYGNENATRRLKDLYWRVREKSKEFKEKRPKERNLSHDSLDNELFPHEVEETEEERLNRKEREKSVAIAHLQLYPRIHLDLQAYNTLLASYCKATMINPPHSHSPLDSSAVNSLLSFPLAVFSHIRTPDTYTYTIMMNIYAELGDVKNSLHFFQSIKNFNSARKAARGGKRASQEERAKQQKEKQYVLSILLKAFAKVKDTAAAEALLATLSPSYYPFTRPVYHSLLSLFASVGKIDSITATCAAMRKAKITVSEETICTVIKSMAAAGVAAGECRKLHSNLTDGVMGVGRASRRTWLSLLDSLTSRVSEEEVAEIYREGLASNQLALSDSAKKKWLIDLRQLPLTLFSTAIKVHLHLLREKYSLFLKQKREARDFLPKRGIIILLGKKKRQKSFTAEIDTSHLSDEDLWNASASEVSELDDEFLTPEEEILLASIDSSTPHQSYAERYVSHLLTEEWPRLTSTSVNSSESSLIAIPRPSLQFWLDAQSSVREGTRAPFIKTKQIKWWENVEESIKEQRKREEEENVTESLRSYKQKFRSGMRKRNGKLQKMRQ